MPRFGLLLFIGLDNGPTFMFRVTESISAVLGSVGNYIVCATCKVQDK